MKKQKVSDEDLLKMMQEGYTQADICRELDMASGSVSYRIKKLKAGTVLSITEKQFDLQLMDTVRIGIKRYSVTRIGEATFVIRETMTDEEQRFARREPEVLQFSMSDYINRKTGIIKIDQIAPVTVYVDPGLKKDHEDESQDLEPSESLEAKIMSRANQEIELLAGAKKEIIAAVQSGQALPGGAVEQYGKLIAKYA